MLAAASEGGQRSVSSRAVTVSLRARSRQLFATAFSLRCLRCDVAQDSAQGESPEGGVPERGIGVDGVVVSTPLFPDAEHIRSAQVTDDTPDCACGHAQRLGYLFGGAVWGRGDAVKHRSVAGDVIPDLLSHI